MKWLYVTQLKNGDKWWYCFKKKVINGGIDQKMKILSHW